MTQERALYFRSADSSDKEAWIGALQEAITRSADKVHNNTEGVENIFKNIPE